MTKHAVILAGGKGKRLRPYTVVLPKPLMPIGEYPILEVIVRQLVVQGFTHITLAVNHQAELIKAFFGDGSKWGISIAYSLEDQPLGTMGPLKLIENLPDHFLVMNGDILTDIVYADFFNQHVSSGSIFTISSHLREEMIDYGVLETKDNLLTGFKEKPKNTYEVSMGIYMLSKRVLDFIPNNSAFGFDELMLNLLSKNEPVAVNTFTGLWLDIGRPDDYLAAIEQFDQLKDKILYV
ncbi:MAG: nucleotidyltransferase family protein [Sphingobacteriia bacterium]|jgi:NDP-mannose synthase|nr:MAG: nucleotidyltransferase family protein [Sphingobacteriia bacterium]